MRKSKGIVRVLLVCMLVISSSVSAFATDKASYRVVFYDESGAQIKEENREGTVGETVPVEMDDFYSIDGYTFDADSDKNVRETVVKADGSSQLSLFFKSEGASSKNEVAYTVKWFYGEKLLKSEERKAEAGAEVSIIGIDTDALEISSNEYSFDVGNSNNVFKTKVKEDGSSELKLYFTPINPDALAGDDTTGSDSDEVTNSTKAIYTVLWLTNDEGKEIKKEIREGNVGDLVSVNNEDFNDFDDYTYDYDYDAQISRARLESNGTTELKLYFSDNNPARAAANKTTGANPETTNNTTKVTTASTAGTPVFSPVAQTKSNSGTVQPLSAGSAQNESAAPKTGDENSLMVLVAALIISAGVIAITIRNRARSRI